MKMYHEVTAKSVNKVAKYCQERKKNMLIIEVPKGYNPHYTTQINEYELNGSLQTDKDFVAIEEKDYYIYTSDKRTFGFMLSISSSF